MSLYTSSLNVANKIPVDRGVLNGDTLSPYLFIMVMKRVLNPGAIMLDGAAVAETLLS
jgi:hypothetical protein